MRMVDPYTAGEIKFRRRFAAVTCVIGIISAVVFDSFPEIDVMISRQLQVCPDAKAFAPWCVADPTAELLRNLFIAITVLIGVAFLIGMMRTWLAARQRFGFAQLRWLYLFAVLAIGSGLVANVVFKENWGRARPRTIVEFGGTKQFTPPLLVSEECKRNCSFVSGEVSSACVLFFAAALLFRRFRIAFITGGIVVGCAVGAIRIAQGAHYLSDVIFAGVFMALTASVVHVLLIGLWRRYPVEGLALHLRPLIEAFVSRLRPLRDAWASAPWPRIVNLVRLDVSRALAPSRGGGEHS